MEGEDVNRIINQTANAAATAAIGTAEGRITFKIDNFWGDAKDSQTPEQWTQTIERAKDVNRWTDATAASAAVESLRGDANVWAENLSWGEATDKTALTHWPDLKTKFLERFKRSQTPAEKVALVISLKQKANETTETFYDRVENVMKRCTKSELEGEPEADKKGFTDCRSVMTKLMFLQGLRTDIRLWVEGTANEEEMTLDNCRKSAMRADKALKAKQGPTATTVARVAAFHDESNNEMAAELAALRQQVKGAQGNQGKKKNANANAGRSGASAKPRSGGMGFFATQRTLPVAKREWIHCNSCLQWGQHFADECKLSAEEKGALRRQPRDQRPSGQPKDAQYPN
jgi:hypothetical protein